MPCNKISGLEEQFLEKCKYPTDRKSSRQGTPYESDVHAFQKSWSQLKITGARRVICRSQ